MQSAGDLSSPHLGTPIPGETSGMPNLSGLKVQENPLASELKSYGRGPDTTLVHMSDAEVNSLRGLAQQFGKDLTINPTTGLPEAGILGKILPMILGIAGSFVGIPPWLTAAAVGGGTGLIKGDLGEGLKAGLSAFGGASLGTALGAGGSGLLGSAGANATKDIAAKVAGGAAKNAATSTAAQGATTQALSRIAPAAVPQAAQAAAPQIAKDLASKGVMDVVQNASGLAGLPAGAQRFVGDFAAASREGLTPGSMPYKVAPIAAGFGAMQPLMQPPAPVGPQEDKNKTKYEGPYTPTVRTSRFQEPGEATKSSREFSYFDEVNPVPGFVTAAERARTATGGGSDLQSLLANRARRSAGYASGGPVNLREGAFVLDARTVSEIGNGSSSAGQEILARLGGKPVRGPGDGVSDSVKAKINGKQQARVARDEVRFEPEAVARLGGGDPKRGAQKLYALMDKAHKARKNAERGSDTKLRKGLV